MAHFGDYDSSLAANPVLGNAGTTTLGPIQTELAQYITGSIFTDQPGTLYVEQSFDGTHFDISSQYTITPTTPGVGQGQGFAESVLAPTARIRYVNGATPQGIIRLYARTFVEGR